MAGTTADLNVRTLARVAGVSPAQASRVLPGLVELGLVERRDVPPSSLFRLVRAHVAAVAILALADGPDAVVRQMASEASVLPVVPVSVIVFGSFARGEADRHSDVDVVLVRPDEVDEEDEDWVDSVEQWRSQVQTLTGNPVEILEAGAAEVAAKLKGRSQVWRDIRRDGVVAYGLDPTELMRANGGA